MLVEFLPCKRSLNSVCLCAIMRDMSCTVFCDSLEIDDHFSLPVLSLPHSQVQTPGTGRAVKDKKKSGLMGL